MSTKVFCDVCKKELTRNMVDERLVIEQRYFKVEVIISKKGVANNGDLCLNCLLQMLNVKPKRQYVRKGTVEQVTNPDGRPIMPIIAKRGKKKIRKPDGASDQKGDNLIIHVPTGLGDDVKYKVNIAGFETTGETLRITVLAVLEDKFNGKIPDFLSNYEKETIQGILNADK